MGAIRAGTLPRCFLRAACFPSPDCPVLYMVPWYQCWDFALSVYSVLNRLKKKLVTLCCFGWIAKQTSPAILSQAARHDSKCFDCGCWEYVLCVRSQDSLWMEKVPSVSSLSGWTISVLCTTILLSFNTYWLTCSWVSHLVSVFQCWTIAIWTIQRRPILFNCWLRVFGKMPSFLFLPSWKWVTLCSKWVLTKQVT